jgi:hypothetical protein
MPIETSSNPSNDNSQDSAESRTARHAHEQQSLRDWVEHAIHNHAGAIAIAVAFDDMPSHANLAAELNRAGQSFDRTPKALWKVLRKFYLESDANLDAWADQFLSDYDAQLREASDQRQLGLFDDEEPDNTPDSGPFKVIGENAIAEAAKKFHRRPNEVRDRLQRAIRRHPEIGAASADPPGAHDGMKTYGRWPVTKYGVFAPGGIWPWERICKTPLHPLAHSAMYGTDLDPHVHFTRMVYEGERKVQR